MDQQAFRQLLATPRNDAASSSSSTSILGAQKHFGKGTKRNGLQSSPGSSNLLPRRFERSVKSDGAVAEKLKEPLINSVTGEEYVDRAAARRLAREDVDEIEERRKHLEELMYETNEEEEREKIKRQTRALEEKQRQSAVKKGLDLELLAKHKAKLNKGDKRDAIIDDDNDLEMAYRAGEVKEKEKDDKVKRERAVPSKFRPIGSTSNITKEVEAEKPEYIWRDGKRLRKKKKVKVADVEDSIVQKATRSSTTAMPIQATRNHSPLPTGPAKTETPAAETIEGKRIPEAPPIPASDLSADMNGAQEGSTEEKKDNSEDEGGDIFADAGRWQGLDDSDAEVAEDDAYQGSQRPAAAATIANNLVSGKKDWFATGAQRSTHDEELEARLPSDLGNIIKGAEKAKEVLTRLDADQSSQSGSESEEEAKIHPPPIQRLEGFSDSILGREGVRYMLEKKDDDGPDRKRRRKRSKKGKGGYGSD